MTPAVIAHRTCPLDGPENSIDGIRAAARLGADAVEIDIRLTRDGVPMLMHDAILWRTARLARRMGSVGSERLKARTIRGSSAAVPTLDEVLTALPAGLRLAIDIKDPAAGPATLAAVRRHGAENRVLWWSQHDAPLRLATAEAPELEAALLRDTRPGAATAAMLDEARQLGVDAVSAAWNAVDVLMLDQAHDRGLKVYSWCRSIEAHSEKAGLALDGVVTDWPIEARRMLTQD